MKTLGEQAAEKFRETSHISNWLRPSQETRIIGIIDTLHAQQPCQQASAGGEEWTHEGKDSCAIRSVTTGKLIGVCWSLSDRKAIVRAHNAALRRQSAPKELASEEWFKQSAAIEGDSEVGAGLPPFESAPVEVWRDAIRNIVEMVVRRTAQADCPVEANVETAMREFDLEWFRFWQRRVSAKEGK